MKNTLCFALAVSLVGGAGLLFARAQSTDGYGPGGSITTDSSGASVHVAVSDEVDGHVHAVTILDQDLAAMISGDKSVTLETSSGLDGGFPDGVEHTHTVTLEPSDISQLQSSGTVTVVSSEALGHSHIFTFVIPQQCVLRVVPRRPGEPRPQPSSMPSSQPSPQPMPQPSVQPSHEPSPRPSPRPSSEPAPSPSLRPAPSHSPRP
jgi:hypothetical protein